MIGEMVVYILMILSVLCSFVAVFGIFGGIALIADGEKREGLLTFSVCIIFVAFMFVVWSSPEQYLGWLI